MAKKVTAAAPRGAVAPSGAGPSAQIDRRIRELTGWRGETLARVRALIRKADPGIVEEWKWDVPVWSRDGIICTGEAYKAVVKLTFAKGASLEDPARLFNASLEGKTRRAIDLREGETIDGPALQALVRAAATLNAASVGGGKAGGRRRAPGVARDGAQADALRALGKAERLWHELLTRAAAAAPGAAPVWKSYAGSSGRQCVLRLKDRNLAYLKPGEGSFLFSLALSDAATASLPDAGLPKPLVAEILAAPRAPEGRPARVRVDSPAALERALLLLELKVADLKRRPKRPRATSPD